MPRVPSEGWLVTSLSVITTTMTPAARWRCFQGAQQGKFVAGMMAICRHTRTYAASIMPSRGNAGDPGNATGVDADATPCCAWLPFTRELFSLYVLAMLTPPSSPLQRPFCAVRHCSFNTAASGFQRCEHQPNHHGGDPRIGHLVAERQRCRHHGFVVLRFGAAVLQWPYCEHSNRRRSRDIEKTYYAVAFVNARYGRPSTLPQPVRYSPRT